MTFERLRNAHIEWQSDGLPWAPAFDDLYFSRQAPEAETEHVFIAGNNLPERFKRLSPDSLFSVGELGFGSGLNFLCTWRRFQQLAPTGSTLHFVSCEQFPLTARDLARFHALWPALETFGAALRRQYPEHGAGLHRLHLGDTDHPVILDLLYGEAEAMFEELRQVTQENVSAWFLDGFAPSKNPAMWSEKLIANLAALSLPGATLSSYSAAGDVKRALAGQGFAWEKASGYGSKRHMIKARFQPGQREPATPSSNGHKRHRQRVAVIGAGLAGTGCAHALARRGLDVQVYEAAPEPAAGASGNPQGALFLPLHRAANGRAAFLRRAAAYAHRHYQHLHETGLSFDWHPDGALQIHEKNGPGFFEAVTANPLYDNRLVRHLNADETNETAAIDIDSESLFLADSAWLNPALLCRGYLSHPGIQCHYGSLISGLAPGTTGWQLLDAQGRSLGEADHVIVANSVAAGALLASQSYPLKANRGQLTFLRSTPRSAELQVALCGKGYLLPASNGQHCLGSSFAPGVENTEVSDSDHAHNMSLLHTLVPSLAGEFKTEDILGGRAALRCTTRDYLPLAGPVENRALSIENYQSTRTSERPRENFMAWNEGLWLCTGLGSHGITTSPILAESLASRICRSSPPLLAQDLALLEPGRFLKRQLRQNNYEL